MKMKKSFTKWAQANAWAKYTKSAIRSLSSAFDIMSSIKFVEKCQIHVCAVKGRAVLC